MNNEDLIISCILIDTRVHDSVIPSLKPEYFSLRREIITKIMDMYSIGSPIDLYTLIAGLPKFRNEILRIQTLLASAANVTAYVAQLKDDYMRSQMRIWFGAELGITDDPYNYLDAKLEHLQELRDKVLGKNVVSQRRLLPSDIEGILLNQRVTTDEKMSKPDTILSIKEVDGAIVTQRRMFTLGNFSCIIGKAKSRKTTLLSLLAASILNPYVNEKLVGSMPFGKSKMLYFDTEQGTYDCYNTISRIERLSGKNPNILAYSLREYAPSERCQIIEQAFAMWGDEVGFCAVDGIADLAYAINDEEEATRVSSMLLRLTKVYNTHICTIIHQNKNDNFATGHLGSSIMKKAELLISVTKGKSNKNISQVDCDLSRGADFQPFEIMIDQDGLPVINDGFIPSAQRQPDYMRDDEDRF